MSLRPPAGFIRPGFDPLKNPNAPTSVSATGGDASASVSFTAPTNAGGSAITAYYAVSNPSGITATSATSPISVTGLTNGTAYTFNVWALNSYGPGVWSSASGSVTPAAPVPNAVFGGGVSSGNAVNTIDWIEITTIGNAADFGDISNYPAFQGSCASSTRGLWAGGAWAGGNFTNVITYITIATKGNSTDFGALSVSRGDPGVAGASNSTRGVFAGGSTAGNASNGVNVIDYVTIGTTGNATDFGDLTVYCSGLAGLASTTRACFGGGVNTGGTSIANIGYITIASTGNAINFGNLTVARTNLSGCSSSTRGLFGGGQASNVIDYITIASTGSATDFGDLSTDNVGAGACSSSTRGVFAGGTSADSNIIEYVTIASVGNSSDFGDLTVSRRNLAALSSVHGGL